MDMDAVGKVASAVLVPVSTALAGLFFRAYRQEVRRAAIAEQERLDEREQRKSRRPFLINGDLEEIREAFDLLMTADGNHKRRLRDLESDKEDAERIHRQLLNRIQSIEDRLNRRGDVATA